MDMNRSMNQSSNNNNNSSNNNNNSSSAGHRRRSSSASASLNRKNVGGTYVLNAVLTYITLYLLTLRYSIVDSVLCHMANIVLD